MSRQRLPSLPYPLDGLEPHLSKETLEIHYGKHHRAYVDKLNKLAAGTIHESQPLETIIKTASGPVFDNAAQIWNHTFYWNSLSPEGGGKPLGDLGRAIERQFGSFSAFKTQFTESAVELFGSGWVWLVADAAGGLEIRPTANAGTPLTSSATPLLACDVWEHAYYIDHRNNRAAYMQKFWMLANWSYANTRLDGPPVFAETFVEALATP